MISGRQRTKVRGPRRVSKDLRSLHLRDLVNFLFINFLVSIGFLIFSVPVHPLLWSCASRLMFCFQSKGLGNTEDVDFDSSWAVLSSSLHEIHTKNASSLSFEELYRNAYKLVLKKKGEPLYLNVTAFEKQWLIEVIRPRILAAMSPSLLNRHGVTDSTSAIEKRGAGELLLKSLKNAWDDHLLCMNMTTDVLMYMVSTLACALSV